MEHSEELTFADCFHAEREIYRAIISAGVMARWVAEHDTVPTDEEAMQMVEEINRQMSEAWAEIYALAVLRWRNGQ
ncbi:MAG: antitoxin [Faecousia sp.]